MQNLFNKEIEKWERPWDVEKFTNLYNRDDRFFSLIIKGLLAWLNDNIHMYGKPILHFIHNTGSSYLYMESNGYEYKTNETTGEDAIYMTMPRCVLEFTGLSVQTEELTNGYAMGTYERISNDNLQGFASIIKRFPLELNVDVHYVLSNFNESIILLQELIDKVLFQRYYNITYLGKVIQCSIEFPIDQQIQINKIDMESKETNQKLIDLNLKVCTNYPVIDIRSEIKTDSIISKFREHDYTVKETYDNIIDSITKEPEF